MSESEEKRPRRALAPEDDEQIGPDDTPRQEAHPARRGSVAEDSAAELQPGAGLEDVYRPATRAAVEAPADAAAGTTREAGSGPTHPGAAPEAGRQGGVEPPNPFARPGSQAAARPVAAAPTPVLPVGPVEDVDHVPASLPSAGRRVAASYSTEPGAAPRRSAVTAASPADDMIPAPWGGASASRPAQKSWYRHYRRTIALWVIAALVAALLIAAGVYAVRRAGAPEPPPSPPTSGSPTPSASASPSPTAQASADDLLSVEDANLMVRGGAWAVTNTVTDKNQEKPARAACLSADLGEVNPLQSYQRTLGTTQKDGLAALHQIDVYASVEAAKQVQLSRMQNLATCDEVPARIVSASKVSGAADEVHQLVVAYENNPTSLHTVTLARTGRALSVLDVTRVSQAVPGETAAAALVRSLKSLCDAAQGTCPTTVKVAATPPPAAPPPGWLIPADLPRLTPPAGHWTATDPVAVRSPGTGCENITLATVAGPTRREQRTFLLNGDAKAPPDFGLDQMNFTFATPAEAAAFSKTLADNVSTCKKRMLGATVAELKPVTGIGEGGAPTAARLFTLQQATSDTSSVLYQLVVGSSGKTAFYTLATVTEGFKLTEPQLAVIAARQGERASQAKA